MWILWFKAGEQLVDAMWRFPKSWGVPLFIIQLLVWDFPWKIMKSSQLLEYPNWSKYLEMIRGRWHSSFPVLTPPRRWFGRIPLREVLKTQIYPILAPLLKHHESSIQDHRQEQRERSGETVQLVSSGCVGFRAGKALVGDDRGLIFPTVLGIIRIHYGNIWESHQAVLLQQ